MPSLYDIVTDATRAYLQEHPLTSDDTARRETLAHIQQNPIRDDLVAFFCRRWYGGIAETYAALEQHGDHYILNAYRHFERQYVYSRVESVRGVTRNKPRRLTVIDVN